MKGSVFVGWLFLAIWAVWLFALQGRVLGSSAEPPRWFPDCGVLLFVSLAPFLRREDVLPASLLIACSRIALSIDPPAAILTGHLAIGILARGVRRLLALEGVLVRMGFAALATWALLAWIALANALRATHVTSFDGTLTTSPWRQALATALVAALAAPLLARLPGLTPLRKRHSWATAVSFT